MLELPDKISGPVSILNIHAENDKNILIFGDVHFSKKNICKQCNSSTKCVHLQKFIDTCMESKTEVFDIFVETPFIYKASNMKSLETVTKNYTEFVGDIAETYTTCLIPDKTQCKKENRIHYTDLRTNEFFSYPFTYLRKFCENYMSVLNEFKRRNYNDISVFDVFVAKYDEVLETNEIEDFFSRTFKTRRTFSDFVSIIYKSDTPVKDIRKILPKKTFETFYQMKFFQANKISKSRKQALKIPEYTNKILKFYHDKLQTHYDLFDFSNFVEYKKLFNIKKQIEIILNLNRDKLKQYIKKIKDLVESIYLLMLELGVCIMDIYVNSRMIYYNKKYNSNIIIFIGYDHAKNYRELFKYIDYGKEIYFLKPAKLKNQENHKDEDAYNRCLPTS